MRRVHRLLLACAALLALLVAVHPARACELAFLDGASPEERPNFCTRTAGAMDFEVVARHESEGDATDDMFLVDPATGEATPTSSWRPDAYWGPHIDVQVRILARYGKNVPERLALIELLSEGPPRFVPGSRWRLYHGHRRHPRGEQVVVYAHCAGDNPWPLQPNQGAPSCPFDEHVERPAAQRHGCASCHVGAAVSTAWRETLFALSGAVLLVLRRVGLRDAQC